MLKYDQFVTKIEQFMIFVNFVTSNLTLNKH